MTIYDIDPTELIERLAKELKKTESINPPKWASFVKTGAHKERPPAREDWWYVRSASVLRKVRLKGPIGVSKLKIIYGGKKNRGYAPERFKKGSGNIIRKILQQLEKAELLKQDSKGVHKGRIITPKGIKLMDAIAKKKVSHKPVETKKEKKAIKEEKPKTTGSKTEKLVKKTKEFAQGKIPTAEKLVEEAKKERKEEPEKKEEVKKEEKKPVEKETKKVPTAAELATKKEEKNG